ncbi:MAG: hypothetical protein AAFW70_13895 [Cyanobacteria bacterium J06635_10]
MSKIVISELRPAGADLFEESESFLQELTDAELDANKGGRTPFLPSIIILIPDIPPSQ